MAFWEGRESWREGGAREQWPAGQGLRSRLPLCVFATSGLGVRWEGGPKIHSSAIVVIRWFWMTFLTSFSSEFICRQIMSWILAPPLFDKEQLFCLVGFRRGKWGTGHSVIHPLTWGLLALFLLPWWEFTMQCICWDSSLHWKPTNTFSWSWRADS